jgi:peptidyl-prolyl cis-trans isomerase D
VEEIRARVEGGEDFAELAKTLSEDPGSAGQGGDLGLIERGLMDPAFDQAAFELEESALSQAVRSQFGYHLIQVTEIEESQAKPFEDVRERLAEEATKRGAEGVFFDWAERLANLSYENPDSLEPAAEALGLELVTSDWVDRDGSGGEGVLANPKVLATAFSDDVLKEGLNSELVEPDRDVLQAVVLRVIEHEEAATKSLDQVREQIVETLRDQRAAEAAMTEAEAIASALESGAALATVAGQHEVTEAGLITRDAPQVPPGVRDLAFTMPRPSGGSPTYGSRSLANGDAAAILVSEVADGSRDDMDETALEQMRRELRQGVGEAYYDQLVADLESRAKIERKTLGSEDVE